MTPIPRGGTLTSDLPFSPILRPQTNTVLVSVVIDALMNLNKTSTKIQSSGVELDVVDPVVLVLPLLSSLVPMAGSETFGIGPLARASVQNVVCRMDFWL